MRYLALGLAAVMLGAWAAPAAAQGSDGPTGAAVGDAGAAVAMMRLVADSVPDSSILPELGELVSATSSFEAGFGLSNAQANSASPLPFERSIAQATPYGAALTDSAPSASGGLIQTAAPDNRKVDTGVLQQRPTPVDALLDAGKLRGSAHARWSDTSGGCVGTIAAATTQTDALRLGTAIPTLPDVDLGKLKLPGNAKLPQGWQGKLGTLAGLLGGPKAGERVLVSVPKGLSTKSTVEFVEKTKSIRSTSQVKAEQIGLLPGTPMGMTATVRKSPTLAVTATGDPKTSRIKNQVAEISVRRGGQTLFQLDRAHPRQDIPIGVPKAAFTRALGKQKVKPLPIVGGVAESTKSKAVRLSERARKEVVDLFVLRLSVGGLNTKTADIKQPFDGHQVAASARLLDVQLLPTEALVDALRGQYDVPSTLAQYAVGEQVVRGAAPKGGAKCGRPGAGNGAQSGVPASIDTPSPSGGMRPLLWIGAALVLGGAALLVAFAPRRRTPRPGATVNS